MMLETEEEITWEDWLFLSGKFIWAATIIQYTLPILVGFLQEKQYPDHEDLIIRKVDPCFGIEVPSVKKVLYFNSCIQCCFSL